MIRNRRSVIAQAVAGLIGACATARKAFANPEHPNPKWYEAAALMRSRAEAWGDQSYGAVLVAGGAIVGEGPSRVVKDKNSDAHAERVAILDAQRRVGGAILIGAVLYSTSRPCSVCESAAHRAGVTRMYFGPGLQDAGQPRVGPQ